MASPTYEQTVIFKNIYVSQESVMEKEKDKIKKSDSKTLPKTGESFNPLYGLIGEICIIVFVILVLKNKKTNFYLDCTKENIESYGSKK